MWFGHLPEPHARSEEKDLPGEETLDPLLLFWYF
jgi:hypothetical protein